MLSILLVDDESAARRGMRLLLKPFQDVTIIGEAENVKSACDFLKTTVPDLVLLDVEMPQSQGFALKEFLSEKTAIVFVTAHENYAAQAFEVEAIDYLLKPVRPCEH